MSWHAERIPRHTHIASYFRDTTLARLHDAIAAGTVQTSDNLKKLYEGSRESAATGTGRPAPAHWLVFKGANWREEAEILATESRGSGWCVAGECAAYEYLADASSFHVLKIDGQARVALVVKEDLIVETQGPGNEDPGEFWPRVLLYAAVRRLPFCMPEGWRDPRGEAARAAALQGRTETGSLDPASLAARLQRSHYDVQFASAPQIEDPTCRDAITAAWRVIIDEYPAAAAIAPEGFGRDSKLRAQWKRKVARQLAAHGSFQWEL